MESRELELELKLEVELECSLCKDVFREPKTLGCLHSFCLECLEIYAERAHSNAGLKCPICRTPFQIESEESQLSNLPTDLFLLNALNVHNTLKSLRSEFNNQKLLCSDNENEAILYCLDCEAYYCEACAKPHKTVKILKNHQLIPIEEMKNEDRINLISKSNPQIYCQIHQQKELELFCDDCSLSICSLCVPQHLSHNILTLSDNIRKETQSLFDLMKRVIPKEKELQEGINKCEEMVKELEINSTTTQIQINELFNKIRIKLDEKEHELLNKLEEIENYKKKELELQKEELQFGIESIIGSCKMIGNSLTLSNNNNKNDIKLITMKNLYHSRLDYLLNNDWKTEPCHHSFLEFSISKKEEELIYSSISNIGIIDANEISAAKCLISRDIKQRIIENEEFKFEIISYSKDGNQMKNGGNGDNFMIQIEGESKNQKNEDNENIENNHEWEIKDLNNGIYETKIKLKDEGKHSIFVQYNGININSSPFQIQIFPKQRNYMKINEPKLTFGSNGKENGQFSYPYKMTTDLNGNILVCDYGNNRIQVFNLEGKFISTFESKGPHGIAINSKGNIIISGDSQKIQTFNSKGNFISTFGSNGYENDQFQYPYGICVDLNDNIYVCDYSNHRILIFDAEGKFISKIGSQGHGNGQFVYPIGIAINSKGNIIICENGNHRIQIFDSKGNFVSRFGSEGSGNGQFQSPYGLCTDHNDNIFVCDTNNHRIQIFESNGEYITQFQGYYPRDIAIDPNTQNIIVSGDDHKISIF